MDFSHIQFSAPRIEGERISWRGELRWPGGNVREVGFEFAHPQAATFVPRVRPFLFAFLLPAMRLGFPVRLAHPLDALTHCHLMEWQRAYACWCPAKFKVVPIEVTGGAGDTGVFPPGRQQAITAFSGGVDSMFTAITRLARGGEAPMAEVPLRAGMMVHGFDIPEAQTQTFESAFRRSAAALHGLGLPAYWLRTNLRSLEKEFDLDWEYESHGIWLAAALACFEPWYEEVLVPATYAYHIQKLPWGSNPLTDPLFSGAAARYWHDGAAFTKFDKVRQMAGHPVVQQHLRVCWAGTQLDRNCGRCYKCIATQLCFWLSGVPQPACFDVRCTPEDIKRLKIGNYQNRFLFDGFLTEARRQNRADLVPALRWAVWRARWKLSWRAGLQPWKTVTSE